MAKGLVGRVIGVELTESGDDFNLEIPSKPKMRNISVPVHLLDRIENVKLVKRESWYSVIERAIALLEKQKKH